jgi:hypothetical protein
MVEMDEAEFSALVKVLVERVLNELRKYRGFTHSGSVPCLH